MRTKTHFFVHEGTNSSEMNLRSHSPAASSQEDGCDESVESHNSDSMSTGFSPMRKKNRAQELSNDQHRNQQQGSDDFEGDSQSNDNFQSVSRPLLFTSSIASIHGNNNNNMQRGMTLFSSQPDPSQYSQDFLSSQTGNGGMWGRFGPGGGGGGGGGLFCSQDSVSFNQSTLSVPQQPYNHNFNSSSYFSQSNAPGSGGIFSQYSEDMADQFGQLQMTHKKLPLSSSAEQKCEEEPEDSFQMMAMPPIFSSQTNTQIDEEIEGDSCSNSQMSYDPTGALTNNSQGNSASMPPPDRKSGNHKNNANVNEINQVTGMPSSNHHSSGEFLKPNAPTTKSVKPPPTAMKATNPNKGSSSSSGSAGKGHGKGSDKDSAIPDDMVMVEKEKVLQLHPVVENPFLRYSVPSNRLVFNHPAEEYFQRLQFVTAPFPTGSVSYKHTNNNNKKTTRRGVGTTIARSSLLPKLNSVWVSPYEERSRYYAEFEEILDLGKGTFSKVVCVRHRLDGMLYAIKKIQERIVSKTQETMLLREVNALALLSNTSCPHLIRYYTSWIEEGKIYIQLELCEIGCLEDLISTNPTGYSLFATNLHRFTKQELEEMKEEILSASAANVAANKGSGKKSGKVDVDINAKANSELSFFSQITPTTSITGTNHVTTTNTRAPSKFNFEDSVIMSTPVVDDAHSISHAAPSHQRIGNQNENSMMILDDSMMMRTIDGQDNKNQSMGTTQEDQAREESENFLGIQEALAWKVLLIVSETLEFMHNHGIVHLDLRPANIFLQESFKATPVFNNASVSSNSLFTVVMKNSGSKGIAGSSTSYISGSLPDDDALTNNKPAREEVEEGILSGKYVIKVGDLGHCRGLYEKGLIIEGENRYCARELINSEPDNLDLTKADIFSLGASVYELCLGRFLGSSGEDEMVEWHNIR